MLCVNIICVGNLKEKYWCDAVGEYSKRLGAFCKFSVVEIAEEKLRDESNESNIENALCKEGERILSQLKPHSYSIALCIEGKQLSSEEIAETVEKAGLNGFSTVNFIIGSSYGLSDAVKQKCRLRLSLSKVTMPHQLARVLLCEQIYRAFTIINGIKYHK